MISTGTCETVRERLYFEERPCDFAQLSRMIRARPIFPSVTPASYPRQVGRGPRPTLRGSLTTSWICGGRGRRRGRGWSYGSHSRPVRACVRRVASRETWLGTTTKSFAGHVQLSRTVRKTSSFSPSRHRRWRIGSATECPRVPYRVANSRRHRRRLDRRAPLAEKKFFLHRDFREMTTSETEPRSVTGSLRDALRLLFAKLFLEKLNEMRRRLVKLQRIILLQSFIIATRFAGTMKVIDEMLSNEFAVQCKDKDYQRNLHNNV